MEHKWTYLAQFVGLIAGAAGLISVMDHRRAVAALIFGALAFYVGGFLRAKQIL